jgi:hypothetical protein
MRALGPPGARPVVVLGEAGFEAMRRVCGADVVNSEGVDTRGEFEILALGKGSRGVEVEVDLSFFTPRLYRALGVGEGTENDVGVGVDGSLPGNGLRDIRAGGIDGTGGGQSTVLDGGTLSMGEVGLGYRVLSTESLNPPGVTRPLLLP